MEKNKKSQNVSILLVEDDEVDVFAFKRFLKKQNIQNSLYCAECGVDALEILRGENDKEKILFPYIMLIDINMPRMDGFEFLQEVRKDDELKDSIAFILTTSSRDTDIETAYDLNAAGYFLKSDMQELTNMLSVYERINVFPKEGVTPFQFV